MRYLILLFTVILIAFGSSSRAFAWGCVAEAEDGGSGWSERYRTRQAALKRAMAECAANSEDPDTCQITDCNQDW